MLLPHSTAICEWSPCACVEKGCGWVGRSLFVCFDTPPTLVLAQHLHRKKTFNATLLFFVFRSRHILQSCAIIIFVSLSHIVQNLPQHTDSATPNIDTIRYITGISETVAKGVGKNDKDTSRIVLLRFLRMKSAILSVVMMGTFQPGFVHVNV